MRTFGYALSTLLLVALTTGCDKKYKQVGCYWEDKDGEVLFNARDTIDWKDFAGYLSRIACKCDEAAKDKGYKYFALRFYGVCIGLTDIGVITKYNGGCMNSKYKACEDGSSGECVGKDFAETIYEIGVDGGYGDWGKYGECSVTCGEGQVERSRPCDNPKRRANGNKCDVLGPAVETKACKTAIECPVDGKFGEWSSYGACSATCGEGSMTRTRACDSPAPVGTGKGCVGPATQSKTCEQKSCPVDGGFGDWSSYDSCSKTCGGGLKKRTRECNNPTPVGAGKDCVGAKEETASCGNVACPVDGKFGEWSSYGACSATCGGGSMTRTRACDSPAPLGTGKGCVGPATQSKTCALSPCPVDGGFGDWSSYDSCSKTCGGGLKKRTRECNNPAPVGAGKDCVGAKEETASCGNVACPVDGKFGEWSSYGACSAKCGGGSMTRTRACDSPAPVGTGKTCVGPTSESKACGEGPCSIDGGFGDWSSYSSCSKTCGGGVQKRTRDCNNPTPVGAGKNCVGAREETKGCVNDLCKGPDGVDKAQKLVEKFLKNFYKTEYPGKTPSGKFYKAIFDIQKAVGEAFTSADPKAKGKTVEERLKDLEKFLKVATDGGSIDFARSTLGKGLFTFMKKKIKDGLPIDEIDKAAGGYLKSIKDKIGEENYNKIMSSQGDSTLMFTMDTTGSMADEIDASKAIARQIIDITRDFEVDYILSPFNDPGTGPVTYRSENERKDFITDIGNLRAHGGGDCPELAFKGMINALDQGPKYGSPMFVFTDASPKDDTAANVEALKAAADLNSATITFFAKPEGCTDPDSHKKGIDSFKDIASYTSGQIFPLTTETELTKFADYVSTSLSQDTMIASGGTKERKSKRSVTPGNNKFSVDDGVVKLIVPVSTSVESTAQYVTLTDPSGNNVAATNTMSMTSIFIIDNPASGIYSLVIPSGAGKYEYKVEGVSKDAIEFAHNFIYQENPRRGSPPYSLYNPIKGVENQMTVRLGGVHRINIDTLRFDLVDLHGKSLISNLKLTSADADEVLATTFTPPNESFKVRMTGNTKTGTPFERISRLVSQASNVFVRPMYAGDDFTVESGASEVRVQVQALLFGSSDSQPVEVQAKARRGSITAKVSKNIRRMGYFPLTYNAPAGHQGKTETITVTATNTRTGEKTTNLFSILLK